MIEHPWIELQVLIREKWLTQKAFSSILWKKVSEVNELLKWKRNITIQRDYLLHQTLWTPIKYRILKQVDYDYSLIDIEESDTNNPGSVPMTDYDWNNEQIKDKIEPGLNWVKDTQDTPLLHSSEWQNPKNYPLDKGDTAKPRGFEQSQKTAIQEQETEIDEDFKNRANIFRNF